MPHRQRSRRLLSVEYLEQRNLLDSDTLYLAFDGALTGAEGEEPLAAVGTSFEPGLIGEAVHTGDPGYARYANADNVTPGQGTVSFWIKPDWNGGQGVGRLFFEIGNGFNNGMLLSVDGANNLRFIRWGDNPDTPPVERNVERDLGWGGAGWVAGNWYHLAATWDDATRTMVFYVDGQPVRQRTDGVIIDSHNGSSFTIASNQGGTQPAQAAFDDFRVSDYARGASSILDEYHAGRGVSNALSEPRGVDIDSGLRTVVAETGADRVVVFDYFGQREFRFGERGADPGQFNQPSDVAVDFIDFLFVADTGNHRVQWFDSAGNYLWEFGGPGAKPGQLNAPRGVFADRLTGQIYVADTLNQRVQRFNFDLTLDTTWGNGGVVGATGEVRRDHTGFDRPMDVVVHPLTREVYVADYGNHRLEVFDQAGNYLRSHLGVYRPQSLTFDDWGTAYIAGADPNDGYTAYDGRVRVLYPYTGLAYAHYTGGLDDLGRDVAGVAYRPDGALLVADTRNGRMVRTDFALTRPATDLTVEAHGTSATFRWRTAAPAPSSVRYGTRNTYGNVVTDPTPTTEHLVTVTGLTPNTRLYYGVSFPDSFDGSDRFTPQDVMNTGAPAGQTQFLRLKAAAPIYTDTQRGPGYTPMTPNQLAVARARLDRVTDYYWRNSGFKLWLDMQVVEVDRDITTDSISLFGSMQADLAALGYGPADDFDAAFGTSVLADGNFGGGGSLFGRFVGMCQWVSQDDFVAIHEINHSLDSIYDFNELRKYEFNHGIWAVPGGLGHDFSTNGQILRNLLPANFAAVRPPFTKVLAAADADGDGVPDASPGGLIRPLSITEETLGSLTTASDSDGDGVSDLVEATALAYANTNPLAADSDGDGVPDALDLNPSYRMNDQVYRGSPTIDGTVGGGEGWTVLTDRWGFTNIGLVADNNQHQDQVTTYAAWDDGFFYLALRGPATTTRIWLDGSADNWFLGPDNYLLNLANGGFGRSVAVNVGVPDLFRQIDDDGQFSEFFDTNRQFTLPYNGRPIYNQPNEGLGFAGRLVTEDDLLYSQAGGAGVFVWEVAIPWSAVTLFWGYAGKELALALDVSGDRLFSTDHAARLRLVDGQGFGGGGGSGGGGDLVAALRGGIVTPARSGEVQPVVPPERFGETLPALLDGHTGHPTDEAEPTPPDAAEGKRPPAEDNALVMPPVAWVPPDGIETWPESREFRETPGEGAGGRV